MRLVRQRSDADCGLAAIAMVTGLPYARVERASLRNHHEDGMAVWEAMRILYRLTGERWQVRFRTKHRRVRRVHLPPGASALVLIDQRDAGPHWIAWDGARLFDPSPDHLPLARARRGQSPAAYSASTGHSVTLARVIVPRASRWLPPALVHPHRHREPHLQRPRVAPRQRRVNKKGQTR